MGKVSSCCKVLQVQNGSTVLQKMSADSKEDKETFVVLPTMQAGRQQGWTAASSTSQVTEFSRKRIVFRVVLSIRTYRYSMTHDKKCFVCQFVACWTSNHQLICKSFKSLKSPFQHPFWFFFNP